MRSRRGTHFITASHTLLLIPSMPATTSSTITTPISTENIKIYLAITISARVNIVYKWVTKIVKDVQAVDC